MAVEVSAVSGGRDLKRFIDLPFGLHANHPLWVPPLKVERRLFLNRRLNAFFSHGEAEYFLARRDGRVVGRISAQINHAFNEHQGKHWGWFGFLELEDDDEVAQALLEAAGTWLRARGSERMVGPADFSMNEESGRNLPFIFISTWLRSGGVIAMPTTSPVSSRSAIMNQFLSKTSCSSCA